MDDLFLILIFIICFGLLLMVAGLVADWIDHWLHWDNWDE